MADSSNNESPRLMDVTEVTREITDHNGTQTTLKYFGYGVFHTYRLGGQTGRKALTEECSAKVRYRLCSMLRTRGLTIAQAGFNIAKVCGEDDNVIIAFVGNGLDADEIYDLLRPEVLKLAGF